MSAISREAASPHPHAAVGRAGDARRRRAARLDGRVRPRAGGGALLFHVSQLAQHTRNLVAHPRGALAISEPDALEGDPQRLQRVTLTGTASVLHPNEAAYLAAAEAYIGRFPDAQMRFELGDFLLFRFTPAEARYVGGFARAARFSWADIVDSGLM